MRVRDKVLYVEKVTVSFDGFKALNELSLYVDPGELLCIIGPNGAGKTTMMDVITGKTLPDSGSVWFGRQLDLLQFSAGGVAQLRARAPQVMRCDGPEPEFGSVLLYDVPNQSFGHARTPALAGSTYATE